MHASLTSSSASPCLRGFAALLAAALHAQMLSSYHGGTETLTYHGGTETILTPASTIQAAMKTHGSGTFEVTIDPQEPIESADGVSLSRMSGRKTFQGDLEATSTLHMLAAGTEVKNSGAYVAIERITGTLHGKGGSFVVQHSGTMTRGAPHLTVTVVPDSGTGQLTGLEGTMTIRIAEGKHFYEIDYTLSGAR